MFFYQILLDTQLFVVVIFPNTDKKSQLITRLFLKPDNTKKRLLQKEKNAKEHPRKTISDPPSHKMALWITLFSTSIKILPLKKQILLQNRI